MKSDKTKTLRAIVEIGVDGKLVVYPIADSDQEREAILKALAVDEQQQR
jgi:hypothetical protein